MPRPANSSVTSYGYGILNSWPNKSNGTKKIPKFGKPLNPLRTCAEKTFTYTYGMLIQYSARFRKQYLKLHLDIQALAEERILIFEENPSDPRLKTHKLNGKMKGCWAFSINYSYRIIFYFFNEQTIRLSIIGNHDIYE